MAQASQQLGTPVAVIGGGPAGLMAAEVLAAAGRTVTIYDRMPTFGRKLLLAGRGGLNLTHTEARATFLARYGDQATALAPCLDAFPPAALQAWCAGLGIETFVGSSGRLFPVAFKASPLLRAWLRRLVEQGVHLAPRHTWTGWGDDGTLVLQQPGQTAVGVRPSATVLALGGASWPHLGADGGWVPVLRSTGIPVHDLAPANCACEIAWSPLFRDRHVGTPLKRIAVSCGAETIRGEAIVSASGIEGGAVYAIAAPVRRAIAQHGHATLTVDLRPDMSLADLAQRLSRPRGAQSLSNHLRKTASLAPAAIALLREDARGPALPAETWALAERIKGVLLRVDRMSGLARAISSAGGIDLSALDTHFMLRAKPGVFVAGEMLDWEAPTGGYLLQACFATGRAAAVGALRWLGSPPPPAFAKAWQAGESGSRVR